MARRADRAQRVLVAVQERVGAWDRIVRHVAPLELRGLEGDAEAGQDGGEQVDVQRALCDFARRESTRQMQQREGLEVLLKASGGMFVGGVLTKGLAVVAQHHQQRDREHQNEGHAHFSSCSNSAWKRLLPRLRNPSPSRVTKSAAMPWRSA